MNQSSSNISINPKKRKKGIVLYTFIFLIISFLGFIVSKEVSLPQFIIRPVGVTAIMLIFYMAFLKPDISFLILVIYLPFSRILVGDFDTGATGFNLTNILMFIASIGWVIKSASHRYKIFEKSTLNLPIFVFILWGITSLIHTSFSYGSLYFESFIIPLKRWLTPIILYFIALNIVKDKDMLKKVVITMMLLILIVGIMAARDYMDVRNAGSLEKSRVGGVFEQPNSLGGFFVYNMFLFLGFFLVYFPNYRYLLMLIPFLICFRGIQVTFSRGAYIGCAFGGIATTFFKSRLLFIIAISLLIFAILNPILLPAGIRYRMASTFHSGEVVTTDIEDIKDPSAQRRIMIWRAAIQMVKENPLFGIGYGLFQEMMPFYADLGKVDAHNTYLILAAEMGIPALIIFIIILLIMIKNSHWLYKRAKDRFIKAFSLGMLGGLFGLIIVNMFGSRLNSEEISAYFWIYAGLIMAAVRMVRKEEDLIVATLKNKSV